MSCSPLSSETLLWRGIRATHYCIVVAKHKRLIKLKAQTGRQLRKM